MLFDKVRSGKADAAERALFRAQMLTEMARIEPRRRLVLQIHPAPGAPFAGDDEESSAATRPRYAHPDQLRAALEPLLDAVGPSRT